MDMYKLKFTVLQQEILRLFFIKTMSLNERGVARHLSVSPTAVSNSLKELERERLIIVSKDKESNRLSIMLNRKNPRVFWMKRVENLRLIYESGLAEYLSDKFPSAVIILFGSYSFGEDTEHSDVDIAVIGEPEKYIDLSKYDGLLERTVSLHFYDSFAKINKNLRENILSGIVLKGGVSL